MKDSLIGINEGIEELTLTLLIGIKADLLQFILYPDRLLKLSNSLIILLRGSSVNEGKDSICG